MACQFQPRLPSPFWIKAEDGAPTSFQPPRPETPPLADGLPRLPLQRTFEPCRRLHKHLSTCGENAPYGPNTGRTNSRPPPPSTPENIHQYSDHCVCPWCEDKRDVIPATLPPTRRQSNSSLRIVRDSPISPRIHEYSVNCACSTCEARRCITSGSPITRQQPNPFLDFVSRHPSPVISSPELSPAVPPPTSLPPSHEYSLDCDCFLCDDVRIENCGRGVASPEPALPIQSAAAVPVASAFSEVKRNPPRRAKEKALVGIRNCSGKKSKFLRPFGILMNIPPPF